MGWRVSYYRADKDNPLIMAMGECGFLLPEINGEMVASNQGTEFWIKLKGDESFRSEIECLYEDTDVDYYSITKNGFRQIIMAYRDRIIEYHRHAIENDDNPELMRKSSYDRFTGTPRDIIESELREWESTFTDEYGHKSFFYIDLSGNNNLISGSWKYKYAIFDMIHVYKTFDWDNYTMVVYGG